MAKKRTKNRQNENARKKKEAAQHRNDYIQRLKAICDLIHPDLYGTLTPIQIDAIYFLRGAAVKVVADGKVSKEVMLFANEYSRIMQKCQTIKLTKAGTTVNLGDYHYIVSPLEWMIRPDAPYEPEVRPNPDIWTPFRWYREFIDGRERRFTEYITRMRELQLPISMFMSDLRNTIYSAEYTDSSEKVKRHAADGRMMHFIQIRPLKPERKKIILSDGAVRSAVRLTIVVTLNFNSQEFMPIEMPSSYLGKKGPQAEKMLPVYITNHALNRIEERLGCNSPGYTQFEVFQNLYECNEKRRKIIRGVKGRLLVEYQLYGQTAGYMVVSVLKTVILVHTFLLVTNNSTPEGAMLHEQLGFGKLDKEYLGIDRLATFVHSDIFKYDDTRQLFANAGCQPLINLSRRLQNDILWTREGETFKLASRMRDYLKTDSDQYADIYADIYADMEPEEVIPPAEDEDEHDSGAENEMLKLSTEEETESKLDS
ncbi:MAG: hypothetical protein LBH04_06895 [Tannerellaceae bacterium]|jgi:hypothetical protein|nr:hypothetical protein [Tannerellaceae bacterium]